MDRPRTPRSTVSPRVFPSSPRYNYSQQHPRSGSMMDRARFSAPNLQQWPYTPSPYLPHHLLSPSDAAQSSASPMVHSHSAVYIANPHTHPDVPPVPPIPVGSFHLSQPYPQDGLQTPRTYLAPSESAYTPGVQASHVNDPTRHDHDHEREHGLPGSYPSHATAISPGIVGIPPAIHSSPSSRSAVGPYRKQPLATWGSMRRTHMVPLYHGNLVLDCAVPTQLMDVCPRKEKEFCHMRYTAVTCDPDEFASRNYTLRPQLLQRETELLIVMTMYNEDEVLFCRTMHGVMKNIAQLCSRSRSKVWDADGWKKVVVCIVADGRKKCDPRVLDVLTTMGVYQKGIAKSMVHDKPVKSHLFEYTTQVSVDANMNIKGSEKGIVPVQVLFCLKEANAKKINSHRWLFNAFGPLLQPNVCVLLDVGTRPGPASIYHLWKTFHVNRHVGGACGEIRVMKGRWGRHLLNPLVAAQNFEYKMSNILDKPFESAFGYISVLPGAFSAYRYSALQNDSHGNGPLQKYFLGEEREHDRYNKKEATIFSANMYLAEDRILCFELLAKKHQRWVLRYVQSAYGETDCPDQLPEFMSQRRRWLNGSFFAAVYSLCHFSRIWSTDHGAGRKLMLTIEFTYNFFNLVFNWLGMANFYLTFYFVTRSLSDPAVDPFAYSWGYRVFHILRYLYIFLFIVSFICSMGNRPQGSKWMFIVCVLLYAAIMCYTMFAGIWLAYQTIILSISQTADMNVLHQILALFQDAAFRNVVLSLAASYGLYFFSSLLYLDPWHMFTSLFQYLLLLPTYVNVLNVYAFCNTHDVSWGTKGDNAVAMDLGVANKVQGEKGIVIDTVEVELADGVEDANRDYEDAMHHLHNKPQVVRESRPPHTKQDDYYRGFRTRLVLAWIGCNAVLVIFATSGGFMALINAQTTEESQDALGMTYTGGLLWIVVITAVFRLFGSILYLVLRLFRS